MGVRASYHPSALYRRTPASAPNDTSSDAAAPRGMLHRPTAAGIHSRLTRDERTRPPCSPHAGL